MPNYTMHVVSHTHWDREWYMPFQLFRIRLVDLVDHVLEILERDPEFKYFSLDGQTIALTLLRCVGALSGGPTAPGADVTPDAQCLGMHTFE